MADAPQMERPGVEVIQEFVSTTPTILRPSLPACIVGPCVQVVEAVTDEGSLNPDALVSVPARLTTPFVSSPFGYPGLSGKSLTVSVNNGAPRAVQLPSASSDITPAKLVDAVLTAAIPGLTARVEKSGDQQRAVLETTSRGDNAQLAITAATSPEVSTAFSWPGGHSVPGAGGYDNRTGLSLQSPDYPDPRGNKADLKVNPNSVRIFLSAGGGGAPIEVSRHEALVAGAKSAVTVVDDGDGDSLSPYLAFADADFGADPAPAELVGTSLPADWADEAQGKVLRMSIDGAPYQTLVIADTVDSAAELVAAINDLWGDDTATSAGGGITISSGSEFGGIESSVRIDKQASSPDLLAALGLTGAGKPLENTDVVHGDAYAPEVGDVLWVDGVRLGAIVEIPVSPSDRVRIDTEQLLTFEGANWRILAQGLNNTAATATRPSSNLLVDESTGTIRIKPGLFQTPSGSFVNAKGLPVYVGYDALRLDVTTQKKANDFGLVRVGSLSGLNETLSPIDTQNPLALGLYYALLNAPGLEVTGCGVDEVNEATPEGTADAYARAFEFLESKDVYSIAPLTHSADVGSIAKTHVDVMSSPTNGLERIAILNPLRPTRKAPSLVASGARANLNGPPSDIVETGLANLPALLAANGKVGPTYSADDNLYIAFEGDPNHYLIESVSGGAVTVNNGPLTDNDGFYFDGDGQPVFEEIIVDRPFTIAIRGSAIASLTDEAAAYGDIGRAYKHKRVIVMAPDTVKTTLDGLEAAVPGYYAAAAIAGRKASKVPSQPMTEDTLAGFSGVVGVTERYSEPQLRMMAGGGIWILYQDADGQPIRTRHQLTTDVGTLLTRESSILDALDYAAKTLRQTFRNFIGRFNITTGLIEALNLVCDGVRDFFIQNDIFAAFNVVSLEQDASNPDQLSIVADIETLKPLNKIRITMRVT